MPRQPRIQFEGAVYHVMARGNRRAKIFADDADHRLFLRTLGEACDKAGILVYAWVLMGNHYHLALSTPRGNLVEGMAWLQNTYTRRFNSRHCQWGRLFGDRYKSVLVEHDADGPYLPTLIDYIHLNPARAGIISARREESLIDYPWSSLSSVYAVALGGRPDWMAWDEGFSLMEARDTAKGRRELVEELDRRMAGEQARRHGLAEIDGQGLQSTLRRGWYWGTEAFREKMLGLVRSDEEERGASHNRNYRTSPLGHASSEAAAREWLEQGLAHFGINEEEALRTLPRGHRARAAIAWAITSKTAVAQRWIAETVGYRTAANVSQQARLYAPRGRQERKWVQIIDNC